MKGEAQTLLATASVSVVGLQNRIRALCDNGAQMNIISSEVADIGKWKRYPCHIRLHGFNDSSGTKIKEKLFLVINLSNGMQLKTTCLVVPNFRMMLPRRVVKDIRKPDALKGELADPSFHIPGPINMILGASVMASIIETQTIFCRGFRFQDTKIGWLVFGGSTESEIEELTMNNIGVEEELDQLLSRFWRLDEMPKGRQPTYEERICEEIFQRTHRRDETGRYIVHIPVTDKIHSLGSSRATALRRYLALERRFARDPELRDRYQQEMKALKEAGVLRLAEEPRGGASYYLPHHPVLKKFRIVFDASCKTDMGVSLNECQLVGERLQDELFTLLLRFRFNKIAITADIAKMYLQVRVAENQWDLQRLFWRESGGEIKEYWLTRVTFGLASAPFCAVRAMQQCAKDHMKEFPRAAQVVLRDFYMDDCLTGAQSKEEAESLVTELTNLLRCGGFELRKWQCSMSGVIATSENEKQFSMGCQETSVLGLRWLGKEDTLSYRWKGRNDPWTPTKRGVVRDLAQIFDPMGFIGPVQVSGKIFIRKLHESGKNWDEPLASEEERYWSEWRKQLIKLQAIEIPRVVDKSNVIAIHGFSDASEVAYGAVIYAELHQNGETVWSLLASRSRLSPKKAETIPRLELCAALLLVKLMSVVRQGLNLPSVPVRLWSDSMITLHWIKRGTNLKIFAHNRVQTIRELSKSWQWGFIRGELNPADILSRGSTPEIFIECDVWWKGPDLDKNTDLMEELSEDDRNIAQKEEKRCIEEAITINVLTTSDNVIDMITKKVSSLRRLTRILSAVSRFVENCKKGRKRNLLGSKDELASAARRITFLPEEEDNALKLLVKTQQSIWFAEEIKALQRFGRVHKDSKINMLTPFLDSHGLMRILGRLKESNLDYESKHPLLLPADSPLSALIVRRAHWQTLHGGYSLMAAEIRQKIWITRLRALCKREVSRCSVCIRYKAVPMEQRMGNLPSARVIPGRPFEATGIDYAGPFEVKPELPRSKVKLKKWVAVFVCMKTKAVHLELVSDLSSKAFVRAFLRFTSIRNQCVELWSDNGTTFVGANKELRLMARSWIEGGEPEDEDLRGLSVAWRFISPRAPHQGGIWEAAVKSMKFHLNRVVGAQTLNSEEFQTLLAQISCVMNSRPIIPMSDNADDLGYLTPNHLLSGGPSARLFGRRIQEDTNTIRDRYLLLQNLLQGFWKRWSREYLHTMQQRGKWKNQTPNIRIGDLVLIIEENQAPATWKTGRVDRLIPGKDDLVRNVMIKVAGKTGLMTRAIQKLVLLPQKEQY